MNGARTSLQEVMRWHQSDRHKIWVAEARDRFGKMGTISVAVSEKAPRGVEILAFVLSCRVFGFGMESALLNRIKCWVPGAPIFGLFKETLHNGPCHRTYPDNGFLLEGSEWAFRGGNPVRDVSWLSIKDYTGLVDVTS
jgi:predicted enzyme involved in methoxymalonyl-ACP biosynthesis